MTRPLPFPDGSFDLILHPVSNCYIRDVLPVWRECFRVLAPGGVLLSGLDNGINFLFDEDERTFAHRLPFDPRVEPDWEEKIARNNDSLQFSHPIQDQIGGQLKAGFILTDIYEDTNDEGPLKEYNALCFDATWSVKPLKESILDWYNSMVFSIAPACLCPNDNSAPATAAFNGEPEEATSLAVCVLGGVAP